MRAPARRRTGKDARLWRVRRTARSSRPPAGHPSTSRRADTASLARLACGRHRTRAISRHRSRPAMMVRSYARLGLRFRAARTFDRAGAASARAVAPARGRSRAGGWHETTISDLPSLLTPGDLVVANDTRVFPARLIGRRDPSGGAVECLLLERENGTDWQALVHPGQKLKPARAWCSRMRARAGCAHPRRDPRTPLLRPAAGAARGLKAPPIVDAAVDALGHMPLPPYIKRAGHAADRERYQTVFARDRGSVAAPTAGSALRRRNLIEALRARGIGWSTDHAARGLRHVQARPRRARRRPPRRSGAV